MGSHWNRTSSRRKENRLVGRTYYGNSGQRFYARDAIALADALERALAAFPASTRKKKRRTRAANPTDALEATLMGQALPVDGQVAMQKFGPGDFDNIREFIEFCRAGSFRIH